LSPESEKTLTRQLYERLRATILAGSLPPGFRLPSSRDLARDLGVSRNTISLVVEQLAMEGYLDVARGRRPVIATASKNGMAFGGARPCRSSPRRLFRAGRCVFAKPIGRLSTKAHQGRFFPDSPMRVRFHMTFGHGVFDVPPATRSRLPLHL
jgi:DNA-binding transcriptional MocR family regulator